MPRKFEYSGLLMHETEPVSPERAIPVTPPQSKPLTFSTIHKQVTEPVQTPEKKAHAGMVASTQLDDPRSQSHTAEKVAATGLFASAAAALGFAKSKDSSALVIAEDETSEPERPARDMTREQNMPLKDVSGNNAPLRASSLAKPEEDEPRPKMSFVPSNDQGSQTLLTAKEIEEALWPKSTLALPMSQGSEAREESGNLPGSSATIGEAHQHESNAPAAFPPALEIGQAVALHSPTKRPSSASRSTTIIQRIAASTLTT